MTSTLTWVFHWFSLTHVGDRGRTAVLVYKRPPLVQVVDGEYSSEEPQLKIERDESDRR